MSDMPNIKRDEGREERISMEIVVDAYGAEEQAMGWYYYLEDQLQFPFTAECTQKRAISPLQIGDEVVVIGMPPEDECERELFVTIRWDKGKLGVPLSQLKPISETPEQTREGGEDWHYWVEMGSGMRRNRDDQPDRGVTLSGWTRVGPRQLIEML
jgi:hypothetical protein